MADPEELRDDLTCELHEIHVDLRLLGYEQHYFPEFVKETRALAIDAQFQKLLKQIERLKGMKERIQQKSQSNSTLAPAPAPIAVSRNHQKSAHAGHESTSGRAIPWTRGGQFGLLAAAGGTSADALADGPLQGGRAGGQAGGHCRAGDIHCLADGRAFSRAGLLLGQESRTRTFALASSDAQVYRRERDIAAAIRPTGGSGRRRRRKQRRNCPLDEEWSGTNSRKSASKL
jgi:hypothetical protein